MPAPEVAAADQSDGQPASPHARLDGEELTALVLAAQQDLAAYPAVIDACRPLVRSVVRHYTRPGVDPEDLTQVADMALIAAVKRFDVTKGFSFLAFALPTIRGEVRKHFRSSWAVHVPRGLQEAVQRLTPAVAELRHELGRAPRPSEVAIRTGLAVDQVIEAMEASSAFSASSLDVQLRPTSPTMGESLVDPENDRAFDAVEARLVVDRLLPLLSPRSRRIVELRFFEELPQHEIAELMGMSQMHVSRLLRQALAHLSARIDADHRT